MPAPPSARVAIFAALEPERRAIQRAIGTAAEIHVIGLKALRVPAVTPDALVIVAGLAGALDPALRVGDLVLDETLPDLPPELPWNVGRIHTANHLVATVVDKSELFRTTGALAVDMEQGVVRRAIPNTCSIIGLRAISDAAGMALDPAVIGMVDPLGRPRPLAVAATLARRPSLIPHLRELNANAKLALHNLGLGVKALVGHFTRTGDLR